LAYLRISKHYIHLPYLILGMVEGVVFVCSMFIGAHLRFIGAPESLAALGPLMPRAAVFAVVMLVCMLSIGVYQARMNQGLSGVMLRTAVSFLFGALGLAVIFYLFPNLFLGRGIVATAAVLAFVSVWFIRYLFVYKLRFDLLKRRVLVLGNGYRAKNLYDRLGDNSARASIVVVGFVSLDQTTKNQVPDETITDLQGKTLHQYAVDNDIQEIVVALDDRRKSIPIDGLLNCKLTGIEILDVLSFFERETGRVIVDLLHPSWLVFSDGFTTARLQVLIKRLMDFVASALLLVVFWPFMLLTAIAIKIEDGVEGKVFYKQERVGLNGKIFWVYKFRSMGKDAEKGGAQWASTNDVRVTKVGRFIRQYRIDELAQIFNVLRGDMAIVGPRPERPVFVDRLTEVVPYYSERHRVKPGVTGWAQLCYPYGASDEDSKNKLEYDMYYAKNNSILLDLLILMRTVEVILFGTGAR